MRRVWKWRETTTERCALPVVVVVVAVGGGGGLWGSSSPTQGDTHIGCGRNQFGMNAYAAWPPVCPRPPRPAHSARSFAACSLIHTPASHLPHPPPSPSNDRRSQITTRIPSKTRPSTTAPPAGRRKRIQNSVPGNGILTVLQQAAAGRLWHSRGASPPCLALPPQLICMLLTLQVWADNLEAEFASLRAAVDNYPFISMVRELVHAAAGS